MGLATLDIVIVLVYLAGIFVLAQWVSREKAGHSKSAEDYFLASKSLPWWAIGASLIAANISAEQIIGMAGSGYAIGLAIASYEWMAALTLLIVGKFFLPIFLRNGIYTMPQFLEQRYGTWIRTLMAVFWLLLYVFVNLTSILWLGSIAVSQVTGMDQTLALALIGVFALVYQLYGGLKAVALTDIVQVTLLVLGGLLVAGLTLARIGDGAGVLAGFQHLWTAHPDHFHMILTRDNPFYKDLPGLSVLLGGLWVMNISYWGFNQYIIQRALAAKNIGEAQKGMVFAAFLKLLMPLVIVVPGIAAVVLAPDLAKPDQAYPTMMQLLPTGILGLVFAALVAAIVASLASKINSVATIFTLDFYAKFRPQTEQKQLVRVGRLVAAASVLIGILTARPLLGNFDQGFQFIQEFASDSVMPPTPEWITLMRMSSLDNATSDCLSASTEPCTSALITRFNTCWPSPLPIWARMSSMRLVAEATRRDSRRLVSRCCATSLARRSSSTTTKSSPASGTPDKPRTCTGIDGPAEAG